MADNRTPRETTTREHTARKKTWQRPSALPVPEQQDGWKFRWIRTALIGVGDTKNVSSRFREGFEPVLASEHPDLNIIRDIHSRFPDNIEVGGLMLCKIPVEVVDDRNRQLRELNDRQQDAVDNNFMRENDPRMPVLKPERSSRVKTGPDAAKD